MINEINNQIEYKSISLDKLESIAVKYSEIVVISNKKSDLTRLYNYLDDLRCMLVYNEFPNKFKAFRSFLKYFSFGLIGVKTNVFFSFYLMYKPDFKFNGDGELVLFFNNEKKYGWKK